MEYQTLNPKAACTFLKLFCPRRLYVCVVECVYPEAINYIHAMLNLYINVSKFATFLNVIKQFYPWA